MCGFAGLVQRTQDETAAARFRALALKSLARRGPDAAESAVIGPVEMIHTRLSIIDVEGGRQPMEDEAGAIAFNGEIYNHADLRQPNTLYRTRSDTEVLLKGLNTQGMDFLNRADGMFAFAYYNKAQRKVYLARDAFGIKPAYFVAKRDVFAFSSTIPALMAFSEKRINAEGYLQFYMARAARGANTLFDDVHEVPPGHVAVYDIDANTLELTRWLKREPVAVSRKSEAELLDELDQLLHFSVRRHLVSDVPVASLLSGGIDSGLLTAIAARHVPDLACFSIGFKDQRFDDSPYSQAIARKYGLRHFVKFVDGDDLVGMMEDWPSIADDASAEPASVMRYLVAQFARESGFKVVLSGEGADEFFGGYHQYFRFKLARQLNAFGRFAPFVGTLAKDLLWPKSRLVHHLLQVTGTPEYHGTSMIFEPHMLGEVFAAKKVGYPVAHGLKDALRLDQQFRLADDLLTVTDRSTMHASIEARVPFITRYVADFAASLPEHMIIKGRHKKYLLRQLALKYLPAECVTRRKVGFDMPLGRWLRNELRPLVEETLATSWQRDFLRKGAMEKIVAAHMSGKADFADKIWAFITLERNVRALRAMA
ncbi:MAG TPA: asparagine synthase (glutamine-hydrolyzing) [Hyphomonas sp.]|nr:asparagine synthase (glutamine-hydrolyzing) [Hyphomonas sp.]